MKEDRLRGLFDPFNIVSINFNGGISFAFLITLIILLMTYYAYAIRYEAHFSVDYSTHDLATFIYT
jgi:hypothetical protein